MGLVRGHGTIRAWNRFRMSLSTMHGPLRAFLIALVCIVLGVVAIVYWMGLPLAYLAFIDPRGGQPITVMNLSVADAQPPAASAEVLSPAYQLAHVLDGAYPLGFDMATIVQFAEGRDAVQWLTSSDYRAFQSSGMQPGTFALTEETQRTIWETVEAYQWPPVVVVWLSHASLASLGVRSTLEHALQDRGRWRFAGPLSRLAGAHPFGYVFAVGFSSDAEALAWLRSDEVVVARSVARAQSEALVVGVLTR